MRMGFESRICTLHKGVKPGKRKVVSQFGVVAVSRSDRDRFRRLQVKLRQYQTEYGFDIWGRGRGRWVVERLGMGNESHVTQAIRRVK